MDTTTISLFDRLGGKAAVNAAVEKFYERVLADPLLSPYFDSVDIERQKAKQKGFLTLAFGGPARYTGRGLREAHRPLVARGVSDVHFDAVLEHLGATLAALGVGETERTEVAAIAESVRADVLDR